MRGLKMKYTNKACLIKKEIKRIFNIFLQGKRKGYLIYHFLFKEMISFLISLTYLSTIYRSEIIFIDAYLIK